LDLPECSFVGLGPDPIAESTGDHRTESKYNSSNPRSSTYEIKKEGGSLNESNNTIIENFRG